jgi:phosphoribosylpyrophosphate synthetase
MAGELKIFGGRAHPALVAEICEYLNLEAGKVSSFNFSDGETFVQIEENVRGSDIFVVQPTCGPVNDNLMELLILLDAFKRSSASRVTAVIPYYGYARQDKKDKPRVPITAKLVADLISRAGADRVLTMDLHADQIQGFFDVPVDHLFAAPVILDAVRDLEIPDLVVVSPDAGGVERARAIAKRLGAGLAIIDKRPTPPKHRRGDAPDRRRRGLQRPGRGRHHRHRRHPGQVGRGAEAEGRRPGPGGGGARHPLRARLAAPRRLPRGVGPDHQHDAGGREARPPAEAAAAVGRAPARRGDPPDSREQLGELPVRLKSSREIFPKEK